ncbi:MAG: small-conductance mechanosensitive channel, partial [Kiritimatiellia bacterium]
MTLFRQLSAFLVPSSLTLLTTSAWAQETVDLPDASDDIVGVSDIFQFINWDMVPIAMLLFVVVFVGQQVIKKLLDDMGERFTDRRLLLKKVSAVARLALFLGGMGSALAITLELRSEAMLALGGTVALAVGLGLQDLLASLMAGVILLIDEPFQVGDRIAFGDYYGEVTE